MQNFRELIKVTPNNSTILDLITVPAYIFLQNRNAYQCAYYALWSKYSIFKCIKMQIII